MENKSHQIENRAGKRRAEASAAIPSGEAVRLIFHGAAGFWCEGSSCKVGFLNSSDNHQHPLEIVLYDENCNKLWKWGDQDLVGESIDFQISLPDKSKADQARFYQPDGRRIPRTKVNDPQDFQWLIDLEGPDLYDVEFENKHLTVYDPQVKIDYAIFYTLKTTISTFLVCTDDNSNMPGHNFPFNVLGPVAEFMAANIYLKSGGNVTITVKGKPVTISKGEIHFFNQCMDKNTGKTCKFDKTAAAKKDRNDFYQHYDAIDLEDDPELLLIFVSKAKGFADDDGSEGKTFCESQQIRTNDEAPCAGAGYGGSGGFPSYP
jgi:hypothetical protein